MNHCPTAESACEGTLVSLSAVLGGTVIALLIVTITLSVLVILLAMKVKQLKLASKLHKYVLIHIQYLCAWLVQLYIVNT